MTIVVDNDYHLLNNCIYKTEVDFINLLVGYVIIEWIRYHKMQQREETLTLDKLGKNIRAVITKICPESTINDNNLEQRLLAMGFIEGTTVTIRHFNWLGRDSLVVEIEEGAIIALRKAEASVICIQELH